VSDRPKRPRTNDPTLTYLFDSLERIELKLDGDIKDDAVHHRNLYIWCVVLSVAFTGSYGLHLITGLM